MKLLLDYSFDSDVGRRTCTRALSTLLSHYNLPLDGDIASQPLARNLQASNNSVRQWRVQAWEDQDALHLSYDATDTTQEAWQQLMAQLQQTDIFTDEACCTKTHSNGYRQLRLKFPLQSAAPFPTIAIIDDDPVHRILVRELLTDKYNLLVFDNPVTALAEIKTANVQLVLCDIQMPEMDGWELRQLFLEDSRLSLLPFVFLTSDDQDASISKASNRAIDDYLKKPIGKQELHDCIARVLTRFEQVRRQMGTRLDQRIIRHFKPIRPEVPANFDASFFSECFQAGGGDFIFSRRLDDDSTLILLGDVMGHDEAAHFFCYTHLGFLFGCFHGMNHPITAGECLNVINEGMLQHKLHEESTVTLTAVKLYGDGNLSIACAGHPPPLLLDHQGKIKEIEVGGMLPGLIEGIDFKERRLKLNCNERLILYSDGLFDALQADLSTDQITAKVMSWISEGADQSLSDSMTDLQKHFVAGDIEDDVTVIGLQLLK